jgi:orotate phosphoribosyltransferase-like protein
VSLFELKDFRSHSGFSLSFKIECDALGDEDLATLARIIVVHMMTKKDMRFGRVVGIPKGGLRLAAELEKYVTADRSGPVLIVDDVLTTGESMENTRRQIWADFPGSEVVGVVLFARVRCPDWVTPVFQLVMTD